MEFTPSYKQREPGFIGLGSLVKRSIVTFINEHSEAFEALARAGSPFGGNCLPMRQGASDHASVAMTRKQLLRLQVQLDALTDEVARLSTQIGAARQRTTSTHPAHQSYAAPEKQIGINRFRALQAESNSLA